jgi:hypothetical protein
MMLTRKGGGCRLGGIMANLTEKTAQLTELGRLRNRHVAKLLDYLGDAPPYLETAIKKGMTMFAEDVAANIINSDNREVTDGNTKRINR